MSNKAIVLDANILIRAVLGKWVRERIVPVRTRESTSPSCWKKEAQTAKRRCNELPCAIPMTGLCSPAP